MDAFFRIFPSIALPIFLGALDQTIIAAALPAIAASFDAIEYMSWIVVSYLVAYTVAAPVYGRLGDRFGRRPVILGALALFIASSVICALCTRLDALIVARILQGLGGGGLITLSQAVVGETLEPRARARSQGYIATLTMTSNTLGPVVGAFLTHQFGWRSIFLVNIPLGALAILFAMRLRVGPGTGDKRPFDVLGLLLLAAFVGCTLVAFTFLQRLETGAFAYAGMFVAAALAALVLLVGHERRLTYPLLPVKLLAQPAIWRSDALAACHGATLVALITFIPVYFAVIRGVSPAGLGPLLLPLSVGTGVGSLITGRLIAQTGHTAIFPSVALAFAASVILALGFLGSELTDVQFAMALGLVTCCSGTVMAVVQVTVQMAAGPRVLGAASGTVQLARSMGATLGTGIFSLVLFATLSAAGPEATEAFAQVVQKAGSGPVHIPAAAAAVIDRAFLLAFVAIAGFAAAGSLLAWSIPERRIL
jgi:MFS family permease